MPRRQDIPDDLRGRAFGLGDLDEAGIRRGRARAKDVHHVYFGVHALTPPTTLLDHCHAYAVRLRPGQAFSHRTAALLHGLPLPARLEDPLPLHVAAVRPASPPRTTGVVGERLTAPAALVAVGGLPVCAPSEVWVQLARDLALDELVEVADHLLTVSPLDEAATRRLLERRIRDSRSRSASVLRAALAQSRRPVLSPAETRVRLLLVRAGLPEPEPNGEVFSRDGAYLGRPDLVWRTERVGLEYEGPRHIGVDQILYDVERRETFEDHGWHIIRATKHDLRGAVRRTALVQRVRRRLDARG